MNIEHACLYSISVDNFCDDLFVWWRFAWHHPFRYDHFNLLSLPNRRHRQRQVHAKVSYRTMMSSRAQVVVQPIEMKSMMIQKIYRSQRHHPRTNQVHLHSFNIKYEFHGYLSIAQLDSSWFAFITAFISGALVSLTKRLYKYSRNYRYIMLVLAKEKKQLKEKKDFGQGNRVGSGRIWTPLPSVMRTQG